MKTAGVLGGFGPDSTAKFYLKIISESAKINTSHKPEVLINNVSIPYQIEEALLIGNGTTEAYLPYLIDACDRLKLAGADFIVMPCNTLHELIGDLEIHSGLPFLNIVDETVNQLKNRCVQQICFLGTSKTVHANLYQSKFETNNISYSTPAGSNQMKLDQLIRRIVQYEYCSQDQKIYDQIINSTTDSKLEDVVLGCTDLQILDQPDGYQIFDSFEILAKATAQMIWK